MRITGTKLCLLLAIMFGPVTVAVVIILSDLVRTKHWSAVPHIALFLILGMFYAYLVRNSYFTTENWKSRIKELKSPVVVVFPFILLANILRHPKDVAFLTLSYVSILLLVVPFRLLLRVDRGPSKMANHDSNG